MEEQGSCVQAGGTAVVFGLLYWKTAGLEQMVDSGDLPNWPEDTKERNSNNLGSEFYWLRIKSYKS